MNLDKLKKKLKQEASKNPEKFFPTKTMKKEGFSRRKCKNCGVYFWSTEDRDFCGEPRCIGGYTFINNPPARKKLDFVQVWKEFSRFMKKRGYSPIRRYPTAARWRSDAEIVRASIYDFQPYVVSGEVEPPANPLIIPQFCFRTNDMDNVGITGRHYTGFVMIGQHAFTPPDQFNQEKYFKDMLDWLTKGLGIPKKEITLHEDAWGGGGNLGPCVEFFVGGLEILNQVYMLYEICGNGYKKLKTNVLDMGMGHERCVWITQGTETSYEANMPDVIEKLYQKTGLQLDKKIWGKFVKYCGLIDLEGSKDLQAWNKISKKMNIKPEKLKDTIIPVSELFSIADHTRSLLVTLADGLLPSNKGEMYGLRVLIRRCLDIIEKNGWNIDIKEVIKWHAYSLKNIFPELKENLKEVEKIMDVEIKKYKKMKTESEKLMKKLKRKKISEKKLIELYESRGISPEMLRSHGLDIKIPDHFYAKISEIHKEKEKGEEEKKFELGKIPKTEKVYYQNPERQMMSSKILKIIGDYIILDKTIFYPTSGGQEHDKGTIDGKEVKDVIIQNNVILHKIPGHTLEEGKKVNLKIDYETRKQLMQHHTATHIINGSARELLGNHIWQAGAEKTPEKARLDITHYQLLNEDEIEKLEERANQKIKENLPVIIKNMPRNEAEKKFGFRIYQGGAVPEKIIRIVEIPGFDAEACGGLHCSGTGEVNKIIIKNVESIQDGIIRLEFVAGKAADKYQKEIEEIIKTLSREMKSPVNSLTESVEKLIKEWKQKKKKLKKIEDNFAKKTSRILKNKFIHTSQGDILVEKVKNAKQKELEIIMKRLEGKGRIIFLFGISDNIYVSAYGDTGIDIGKTVKDVCKKISGSGGGSRIRGGGIGKNYSILDEVIKNLKEKLI